MDQLSDGRTISRRSLLSPFWCLSISCVLSLSPLLLTRVSRMIILIWKFNPYADYLHKYAVNITYAANIISGCIVFYFVNPSTKEPLQKEFPLLIIFILIQAGGLQLVSELLIFSAILSCIIIYLILLVQRYKDRIRHLGVQK